MVSGARVPTWNFIIDPQTIRFAAQTQAEQSGCECAINPCSQNLNPVNTGWALDSRYGS